MPILIKLLVIIILISTIIENFNTDKICHF
jgi:hypothetical protein